MKLLNQVFKPILTVLVDQFHLKLVNLTDKNLTMKIKLSEYFLLISLITALSSEIN